jgi:DNA-directed RNA polymerase specialized sigma subunit
MEEKKLTSDDYFKVWKKEPSPRTLTPLMSSLKPTLDRAIKSYGFDPKDSNIRSTAQLHAIKVLNRFDPEHQSKAKLDTFMMNEMRRLQRIGTQQKYAIPVPEQAAMDLKAVTERENELAYELGRDPTPNELSDFTGLSKRRIATIKQKYGMPVIHSQVRDTEGGGQEMVGTEEGLDFEQLWIDAVYDELDGRDKKILDWTLGHHGQPKLTKTEMAKRLKISIPAVTQRAARIANKIDEGRSNTIL